MKAYRALLLLFFGVIALQVILATSVYFMFDTPGDRGTFGDMFGVVNTLFSGLAFPGVIYAIFLQANQLGCGLAMMSSLGVCCNPL